MFEKQRLAMVKEFVTGAGITDNKVISTMEKVPRHEFVEAALVYQAYSGKALPIGYGQTISHPTTVAQMSSNLQISGHEKVLEIGTGSGYQAAVLAEMGAKVYSIERIPELARCTRQLLERLGYYSVAMHIGDGSLGWPEFSPYDRIIVTAASPRIPENLLKQLADTGRLCIPVGDRTRQELKIIIRKGNDFKETTAGEMLFVPLIGNSGWRE